MSYPVRGGAMQVLATYSAGFLQGLALVSFPASSSVLKGSLGLSDAQYGSIFLPQVAMAVVGALGGGALAARLGLKNLLLLSMAAIAGSQLALAGSLAVPEALRYLCICAGTGLLGLGFGLGGAPLNSYAVQFFPQRKDTALVALHSLVGLGLAVGPLLVSALVRTHWVALPIGLAAACAAIVGVAALLDLPRGEGQPSSASVQAAAETRPAGSPAFWVFAAVAVLYAFAEGTFSNWTVVYLAEVRQLPASTAALALSMFWAALVAGRLLVSALVLRIPAQRIWMSLPLLMIAAFWLLPEVSGPASAIAAFALAGLACSAFFPLTIGLVSARFPQHVAWVSSMMIAALMVGVGLGSFVVGPLRAVLSMETLYQVSSAYPVAVLLLALLLRGPSRERPRK
ncbi:MAG: MFS transporter [Panacagrimonas sp.]